MTVLTPAATRSPSSSTHALLRDAVEVGKEIGLSAEKDSVPTTIAPVATPTPERTARQLAIAAAISALTPTMGLRPRADDGEEFVGDRDGPGATATATALSTQGGTTFTSLSPVVALPTKLFHSFEDERRRELRLRQREKEVGHPAGRSQGGEGDTDEDEEEVRGPASPVRGSPIRMRVMAEDSPTRYP